MLWFLFVSFEMPRILLNYTSKGVAITARDRYIVGERKYDENKDLQVAQSSLFFIKSTSLYYSDIIKMKNTVKMVEKTIFG